MSELVFLGTVFVGDSGPGWGVCLILGGLVSDLGMELSPVPSRRPAARGCGSSPAAASASKWDDWPSSHLELGMAACLQAAGGPVLVLPPVPPVPPWTCTLRKSPFRHGPCMKRHSWYQPAASALTSSLTIFTVPLFIFFFSFFFALHGCILTWNGPPPPLLFSKILTGMQTPTDWKNINSLWFVKLFCATLTAVDNRRLRGFGVGTDNFA